MHLLTCRCYFLSGLRTSTFVTRKSAISSKRKRRTRKPKEEHSTKETSNPILPDEVGCVNSVEEVEPKSNQLCNLSEEMKGYVKWMQDGLLTNETCTKQYDSNWWERQSHWEQDRVSERRVDQKIFLGGLWQELFQVPGARYQSLEDERLLTLNKSAPSMTRVLLLLENRFSK